MNESTRATAAPELPPDQVYDICVTLMQNGHGNINIDMAHAFAKAVAQRLAATMQPGSLPDAQAAEILRAAFSRRGEPATDSTGREAMAAYVKLTNSAQPTDSGGAIYVATSEMMRAFDAHFAAREPAPVARDLDVEADPVKGIITGVREFYLGLLSRHLPSEAFDQARADDATTVAYRGVADRFLVLLESATAERAPARCIACGRLQGQPHAAGCKFAPFTIGRAH